MEDAQKFRYGLSGSETASDARTYSYNSADRVSSLSMTTEVLRPRTERTVLLRGPEIPVGSGMKATLFEIYVPGAVKEFFAKLFS